MADKTVTSNIITDLISGAQNVIGGDKLQVGTIPQFGVGKISPTSPEAAITTGLQEAVKAPGQAIEGIKEQAKIISEDEQKLIDLVSSRMGLSAQSPSPGAKSPAQLKAEQLINSFNMSPPVVVDLINSTYGTWSGKGFTFDRFVDLLLKVKQVFQDPQGIKQFVSKLADVMVDAMPLYTPNQMLDIALSGLANKNLNEFNTIILILPFYKSIIENKPVDTSSVNKGLEASTLLNSLNSDPSKDTKVVRENLFNKNKMLQSIWPFYRGVLMWTTKMNSAVLADIANKMKNRTFQTGTLFEMLVNVEMYKQELARTVSQGISGKEVFNTKASNTKSKKYRIVTSQATAPVNTGTPISITPSPAPPAAVPASGTATNAQMPLDPNLESIQYFEREFKKNQAYIDNITKEINVYQNQISSILNQVFDTSGNTETLVSSLVNLYTGADIAKKIIIKIDEINRKVSQNYKLNTYMVNQHKKLTNPTAKSIANAIIDAAEIAVSQYQTTLMPLLESKNTASQFLRLLPEAQSFIDVIASYNVSKEQLSSRMNFLTTTLVTFDTRSKPGVNKVNPVQGVSKSRARAEVYKMGLQGVALMRSAAAKMGGGGDAIGVAMAFASQNLIKKAQKFDLDNKNWFMQALGKGIKPVSTSPGRS